MSLSIESLNKLKDFRPLDLLTQQAQAVLRVAASRLVYFGIFRRPLVCLVSMLFVQEVTRSNSKELTGTKRNFDWTYLARGTVDL